MPTRCSRGLVGRYDGHLEHMRDVIGLAPGAQTFAAMNVLMLGDRTLFLTDTFVNEEPSAEQLAEIATMAADEVRRFGRPAKVAFLSHSNFGSSSAARGAAHARGGASASARWCPTSSARARCTATPRSPRRCASRYLPSSTTLSGEANLLCCPTSMPPTSSSTC